MTSCKAKLKDLLGTMLSLVKSKTDFILQSISKNFSQVIGSGLRFSTVASFVVIAASAFTIGLLGAMACKALKDKSEEVIGDFSNYIAKKLFSNVDSINSCKNFTEGLLTFLYEALFCTGTVALCAGTGALLGSLCLPVGGTVVGAVIGGVIGAISYAVFRLIPWAENLSDAVMLVTLNLWRILYISIFLHTLFLY